MDMGAFEFEVELNGVVRAEVVVVETRRLVGGQPLLRQKITDLVSEFPEGRTFGAGSKVFKAFRVDQPQGCSFSSICIIVLRNSLAATG